MLAAVVAPLLRRCDQIDKPLSFLFESTNQTDKEIALFLCCGFFSALVVVVVESIIR